MIRQVYTLKFEVTFPFQGSITNIQIQKMITYCLLQRLLIRAKRTILYMISGRLNCAAIRHLIWRILFHLNFKVKKQQLITDIANANIQTYQNAVNQSNADTDVYSDGYEEPDPMELFVLDAFASAISDLKFSSNIVALFIGIMDTLDYYENFSDRQEYWNNLLEKEVEFQKEILIQLRSNEAVSASIYKKRYQTVEFIEL